MSERFVNMSDAAGSILPKASTTVNFTLLAGDEHWTVPEGKVYYEQTVDDETTLALITANINGILGLSLNATDEQYEAAAEAQLRCIGQGDHKIVVAAKEKPTVNIPCTVILLG